MGPRNVATAAACVPNDVGADGASPSNPHATNATAIAPAATATQTPVAERAPSRWAYAVSTTTGAAEAGGPPGRRVAATASGTRERRMAGTPTRGCGGGSSRWCQMPGCAPYIDDH